MRSRARARYIEVKRVAPTDIRIANAIFGFYFGCGVVDGGLAFFIVRAREWFVYVCVCVCDVLFATLNIIHLSAEARAYGTTRMGRAR